MGHRFEAEFERSVSGLLHGSDKRIWQVRLKDVCSDGFEIHFGNKIS